MLTACGFVDGDPIVTGAETSTGSTGSTASTGPTGSETERPAETTAGGTGTPATGTTTLAPDSSGDTGPPPACGCEAKQPGDRCLRVLNACAQPIWAGTSGESIPADALDMEARLEPGECVALSLRSVVSGRAWGRTGCDVDGQDCTSDGNAGQGTVVQFDLLERGGDLYNVSLVDAFNLPMEIRPVGVASPGGPLECGPATCAANINLACPDGLRQDDPRGQIAYCHSACQACTSCAGCDDCAELGTPACDACGEIADVCCTGGACDLNEYTMLFKGLCPDAITYSSDGPTMACGQQPDYDITFCP